jgi:hypothetical protein
MFREVAGACTHELIRMMSGGFVITLFWNPGLGIHVGDSLSFYLCLQVKLLVHGVCVSAIASILFFV